VNYIVQLFGFPAKVEARKRSRTKKEAQRKVSTKDEKRERPQQKEEVEQRKKYKEDPIQKSRSTRGGSTKRKQHEERSVSSTFIEVVPQKEN